MSMTPGAPPLPAMPHSVPAPTDPCRDGRPPDKNPPLLRLPGGDAPCTPGSAPAMPAGAGCAAARTCTGERAALLSAVRRLRIAASPCTRAQPSVQPAPLPPSLRWPGAGGSSSTGCSPPAPGRCTTLTMRAVSGTLLTGMISWPTSALMSVDLPALVSASTATDSDASSWRRLSAPKAAKNALSCESMIECASRSSSTASPSSSSLLLPLPMPSPLPLRIPPLCPARMAACAAAPGTEKGAAGASGLSTSSPSSVPRSDSTPATPARNSTYSRRAISDCERSSAVARAHNGSRVCETGTEAGKALPVCWRDGSATSGSCCSCRRAFQSVAAVPRWCGGVGRTRGAAGAL
mmetsp:Transcript_16689/g.49913  ORF Transcript_16689/g.49913 Transcript_16689/m.49913 type:complete len:350 (+) Transcript_16689:2630-3679(+)